MERLDGQVFHDSALPGLAPAERRAVYRCLRPDARPAPCGRLAGDRARRLWPPRQLLRAPDRPLDEAMAPPGRRDLPAIDRLIEWLPRNVPEDDVTTIVHGDFRLGNLMFHAAEPRVIGVLDWELSTLGHPLADLAHAAPSGTSGREDYGGLLGLDLEALGIPGEAEFAGATTAAATARGSSPSTSPSRCSGSR